MIRALLALLLVLLSWAPAWAAVAFDAKMTGGNSSDNLDENTGGANAVSVSSTGMTVGVGASLLVAVIVYQPFNGSEDVSARAMTWNAVSMTEVASAGVDAGGGRTLRVSIFTLVSPTAGNKTLAATWTTGADAYMSVVSFTGTDTATGINAGHTVTGTSGSTVTVTSSANDATVALSARNGDAPSIGQGGGDPAAVKIFSEAPLNPGGGASYEIGGTTNDHTFTFGSGSVNVWAGIHVIAAAAAGGLFRTQGDLTGLGTGGKFMKDPSQ